MSSPRIFYAALVLSSLAHGVWLMSWPQRTDNEAPRRAATELTLATAAPHAPATLPALLPAPRVAQAMTRHEMLVPRSLPQAQRTMAHGAQGLSPSLVPVTGDALERPAQQGPMLPDVVDLSNLSGELKRYPEYLEYFRTIRERIRRYAQHNYPPRAHEGQIYVTFGVSAGGYLQAVTLDQQRSSPDLALQEASLNSLREASPFPPFPEGFQQPYISFRIIIEYNIR